MFSFLKRDQLGSNAEAFKIETTPLEAEAVPSCNLSIEIGGGKGWCGNDASLLTFILIIFYLFRPLDACFILYHKVQGLICVGTYSGAVYVYGDGFQYMRPSLSINSNPVTVITSIFPNRIIVLYKDDTLAVMELPSLDMIHLMEPSWLEGPKSDSQKVSSTA